MRQAAVSIVQREGDNRFLVVWNKRYGGWGFPGGMCEEGEDIQAAQSRELYEETSLDTVSSAKVYEYHVQGEPNRASHVIFFTVRTAGVARECEIGCPVTWMTKEEILKWSPFRVWYTHAIAAFESFLIAEQS
jgi:ADP-ribose pyrophosphatase YjhB (NUDIX family)